MAEKMRYNKIIDLLERGKPVFSTSTVPNGSLDDLTYIADADYDAVIIEMEHEGFSFTTLRTSLQVLLNRKRIAEKGNLQPDVVPMVRIPPNARERNQWVIMPALDTGVYGLVLPHLSTVEDAQAAVAAARYPQVPVVQDFAPAGERGWGNRIASRYWGLTPHYVAAPWPTIAAPHTAWANNPAKLRQKDRDARWTVKYTKAKPSEPVHPHYRHGPSENKIGFGVRALAVYENNQQSTRGDPAVCMGRQ